MFPDSHSEWPKNSSLLNNVRSYSIACNPFQGPIVMQIWTRRSPPDGTMIQVSFPDGLLGSLTSNATFQMTQSTD